MEISWNFVSPKKWEPWLLTMTDVQIVYETTVSLKWVYNVVWNYLNTASMVGQVLQHGAISLKMLATVKGFKYCMRYM